MRGGFRALTRGETALDQDFRGFPARPDRPEADPSRGRRRHARNGGLRAVREVEVIDWSKVWEAIGQIGPTTLIVAGLFAAAAYATLTVYDYFATRTIGRDDIPYPACAVGSFTSYSIAHNLGATVFTAAVVRYLVYSATRSPGRRW